MELFGFEIRKKSQEQEQQTQPSFAPKIEEDGAVVVAAGGVYGTYVDLEGSVKTEAELIDRYREMSSHPEVDGAIDDIVNDAITVNEDRKIVDLNLDDTKLSAAIKKTIDQEFQNILEMLNFSTQAYDIFRRWYIDGRLYYHAIIDVENPSDGIKEIRYLDARKIRKVREVTKKKRPGVPIPVADTIQEYFIYNDKGFKTATGFTNSGSATGVKIAKDSILHVTSGLLDSSSTTVLSHLHKAIKPLNQLRTLEDATVIYRISRAPERRIFYIDVGNLPKMKAEQYLRDMMARHKNKVVYDSQTGELRDDRKFMTMLEDYWLPRREGSRGTEITTLPAGQNLGELQDVEYFQRKLFQALNVPVTRLEKDNTFTLGESNQISRDEIKFSKFIDRLRSKFNFLFLSALEKQLILKGVMTKDEWKELSSKIRFDYSTDNHFEEMKNAEILRTRAQTLQLLEPFAGKYFSHTWIRKNVLMQSDKEIEEHDQEIADEQDMDQYQDMDQFMANQQAAAQGNFPSQPPPNNSDE
jgi:hypothetical protein